MFISVRLIDNSQDLRLFMHSPPLNVLPAERICLCCPLRNAATTTMGNGRFLTGKTGETRCMLYYY